MNRRLILASASPRRKEILRMTGADFEVVTSDCDESVSGNPSPAEFVGELALRKACAVSNMVSGEPIIIGADTVVSRDGRILGKPHDRLDAVETLLMLSGDWHSVYTGLALVCGTETIVEVCETRVKFTELSRDMCERYVDTGEPLDKAGSYGIQGLGGMFVERIDGDYYNVVGLPLSRLRVLLNEHFGVRFI